MKTNTTFYAVVMLVIMVVLSVAVLPLQAQDTRDCPVIVQEAVAAVSELCDETGRNQACYGNLTLSAEPQPHVADLVFENPGDIEAVVNIFSLTLSGMDESVPEWGIAVMKLQANLPDTLPGQNVTFLLFGDVAIENAEGTVLPVMLEMISSGNLNVRSGPSTNNIVVGSLSSSDPVLADGRNIAGDWLRIQLPNETIGWVYAPLMTIKGDVNTLAVVSPDESTPALGPMQAFRFRSGVGDSQCAEAPNSGILIQTPEGVGTVSLNANGVDIALSSTAYLQAQPDDFLYLYLLEGVATLTVFDVDQAVEAGLVVTVPLDGDLRASGPPNMPEPYDESGVMALPVDYLPRPITVVLPEDSRERPDTLLIPGQWLLTFDGGDDPCLGRTLAATEETATVRIDDSGNLVIEREGGGRFMDFSNAETLAPGIYQAGWGNEETGGILTLNITSPELAQGEDELIIGGCSRIRTFHLEFIPPQ